MQGLQKLSLRLSPKEILDEATNTISRSKQVLSAISQTPLDKVSFSNTVRAVCDDHASRFSFFTNSSFPSLVSTDPEVRKASLEAKKKIEEYQIECTMREDLYKVLKAYKASAAQSQIAREDARVLSKLMEDFERNGVHKSDQGPDLAAKKKLVSDLSLQFNRNVNEDTTVLPFSQEELKGLPQSFINALKKNDQGQYLLSLKMPDYIPAMKKIEVEETRKKLDVAYNSRVMSENIPILQQILTLRQEMAQILGFPNWASYNLLPKMANTTEAVFGFLNNLHEILKDKLDLEITKLLELKKKHTGSKFDGKINSWDYSFYQNMLMETEYQVDDTLVQQYFPMDVVTEGMLGIYQEILGLQFEEVHGDVTDTQIWHPDVRLYCVKDASTAHLLGYFYLDLYPRDGKYSHAACFPLQVAHTYLDGTRQPTVVAMVTNFTKATQESPSLLKQSEVKTFFHEFGHVMHAICSSSTYGRLNWTWSAVEQDFLEAPSMMLENWVLQKEVLLRISSHNITKEHLPDSLLEKMIKAKNADAAYYHERLVFMSLYDMHLHVSPPPSQESLVSLWETLKLKHTLVPHTPNTYPPAAWQHITTGYDAGYYGYLWSMVFSADMFTKFKKEGVLNKEVGKLLRTAILEPCASDTGSNMLHNFLGREPTQEAFKASISS